MHERVYIFMYVYIYECVCMYMCEYIHVYIFVYMQVFVYIYICIYVLSLPGFDPCYGNLVCLATLMSSNRTKQICLWMTICICSPTPVGLSCLANEIIVLPLAFMQGSSYMN